MDIDFNDKDYFILTGDALEKLKELPDNSVDCCVTSPPYFNLRDYHAKGQIGVEKTPEEYINNLVAIFQEVKRVLKDTGTLWVNIGDSYCNSNGFARKAKKWRRKGREGAAANDRKLDDLHAVGLKTKDLIGIPWMLAFALRNDGWYLRQDIIWCLSEITSVYVKNKYGGVKPMTIRELVDDNWQEMKLWNGSAWTAITNIRESDDPTEKLDFVLNNGEIVSSTANHTWILADGSEVQAKDLQVHDVLKRCNLPDEHCYYPCKIDNNMLWFIGMFLANGELSKKKINLSLKFYQQSLIEKIDSLVKSYNGIVLQEKTKSGIVLKIDSPFIFQTVHQCVFGNTYVDKRLKYNCWNFSNYELWQLMRGYFDGIGQDIKGEIELPYVKKNHQWRRDLRTLASRLGANISMEWIKVQSANNEYSYYKPRMTWNSSGVFEDCEIVNIQPSKITRFYDISVECNNHLYSLSSGILTHNCKPNPLPESVVDRCTKSHEYIFLLSKQEKYYFDFESIEEVATGYDGRKDILLKGSPKYADSELYFGESVQTMAARGHERWKFKPIVKPDMKNMQDMGRTIHTMHKNRALGNKDDVYPVRRKRDVWTVPTKSYSGAHFATYPEKLIEPCILAGCPEGGVVLDIFNGAATTGVVALKHKRKYIGIELNPEYVKLSEDRLDGKTDNEGTEYLF